MFNLTREVCWPTLTWFLPGVTVRESGAQLGSAARTSGEVTTCLKSVAATSSTNESLALLWLALSLTEGLGPKRGQSLVEDLGGIQNVFKASLTELEAAGIRAVSAQSLAIGQSADLARDELARATAAGLSVVGLDDPTDPAELKQIYESFFTSDADCTPQSNWMP
jgi:hypothetical protein